MLLLYALVISLDSACTCEIGGGENSRKQACSLTCGWRGPLHPRQVVWHGVWWYKVVTLEEKKSINYFGERSKFKLKMGHMSDFYGMLVFRTQNFKVWMHYDQMKHISPLHGFSEVLPHEQILWFIKKTFYSSIHKSGLAYICWYWEVVYNFLHYYKMKTISRWDHYFLLGCMFCVRFLLDSVVCDFSSQVRGVEGTMGRRGNLSSTLWWNT